MGEEKKEGLTKEKKQIGEARQIQIKIKSTCIHKKRAAVRGREKGRETQEHRQTEIGRQGGGGRQVGVVRRESGERADAGAGAPPEECQSRKRSPLITLTPPPTLRLPAQM